MLTLVLAASAPVVRDGLRALLASHGDIAVVAEAETGSQALARTISHSPDVLVIDLDMSICHEIRRAAPETGILVFTDTNDDKAVLAAVRAGVLGYLPKTADEQDLVRAIRNVAAGQAVFGPHVASKVTTMLLVPQETVLDELTPREREVLELLVVGPPVSVIAQRLALTPKTIRNHTSRIFTKLGVSSRDEAVVVARRAGLDRLPCQQPVPDPVGDGQRRVGVG
ncbi:response regulator transcription factor [Kibdelosporangium philippinense]|uniref:Response regulator transcription factor n=1 Tax=Kibdelosporangium philippinense TaxID=211113 RepID=A0ABS8ZHN9_9PSEU|nr:response regulator transcription factor [Kibdelosporangium philippinense]MCE7006430.1 response regulator transcription factor [Kibdelosporangium philippinense]